MRVSYVVRQIMTFILAALPYAMNELAPHISEETLQYHYGKHHQTYVVNLNKLVSADASLAGKSLNEIMLVAKGPVYNNAAQVWNHNFYWKSMAPKAGGEPTGAIAAAIDRDFGSFEEFKKQFSAAAVGHFASGWAWLVQTKEGKLSIVDTHDAGNPLKDGTGSPLLTCDVWEHAYYVDYRNARAKYVDAWWNVINWEFANHNLANPVRLE